MTVAAAHGWYDSEAGAGGEFLRQATDITKIWIRYGE